MLLALVLAALAADPAAPRVASTTLSALANTSDAIVVGRVVSVVCISPHGVTAAEASPGEAARCATGRPIAEVEVERVLRGDPQTRRVWYLAESTWTCDVTQAIPGERALFFLSQSTPVFALGPAVEEANVHTSGQLILHDAWAGRGRMPLRVIDGEEWLTSWHTVEPPSDLNTRPAEWEGEYASIYWSARLDTVCHFVEGALRTRDNPLPSHPVSGLPARVAVFGQGGQIVAAMWGDGTAVWSEDKLFGGPPFLQAEVVPGVLNDLVAWCREHDLESEPPSAGAGSARVSVRNARVLHDLALGEGTTAAGMLRDLVIQYLPEVGVPLIAGSLPVR